MTPEEKVKYLILARDRDWNPNEKPVSFPMSSEDVEAAWEELYENDRHWDAMNEIRSGDVETNVECNWSRHYESKSVASKLPDGSWVGWTYWYGGGKHSEPETVDWMDLAYNLACSEEQKIVTVRTFKKEEYE